MRLVLSVCLLALAAPAEARKPTVRPLALVPPSPPSHLRARPRTFPADVAPDGQIHFSPTPIHGPSALGFLLVGVSRTCGNVYPGREDFSRPTLYLARRRFAEATFEARAAKRLARYVEVRQARLVRLRRDLAALWRASKTTGPERRRILFQLWDECDDDAFGRAARATILAFIRRELPAGSPEGFISREVRELNRERQSPSIFAPY